MPRLWRHRAAAVSGARSVAKGKRYERQVARVLRALYPDARRRLQYQRAHGAADVHAGPLRIEVKAHNVAAPRVYRETAKKAGLDVLPAVVQPAGKGGPLLITLSLRDFVFLVIEGADL